MPNVTLPAPASNVGYLVRSLDKGKAPSRVGTRNKEFLLVDTELELLVNSPTTNHFCWPIPMVGGNSSKATNRPAGCRCRIGARTLGCRRSVPSGYFVRIFVRIFRISFQMHFKF
eukprot:8603126-Pyramimonas_sp.AAC.2